MDQIEFLKDIWDYNEGAVFLAFKSKSGGLFEYVKFQLPLAPEISLRLKKTITDKQETHHCFYTPAIYVRDASTPTKEAATLSLVSWVDIDNPQTMNRLSETPPEGASYLIFSGKGIHVLWKHKDSLNSQALELINKQWIEDFKGDKGTWNSNRLLRIPGTINWKYDTAPTVGLRSLNAHSAGIQDGPVGGQQKIVAESNSLHELNLDIIKLKYSFPDKLTSYFLGEIEPDDRSVAYWEIVRLCRESRMNIHEAYTILLFFERQWKKYEGRVQVELERILNKEYKQASVRGLLRTFSQIHQTPNQVDWLIPNGVTREGLMVFSGPPGVGKTQFSLRTITRALTSNNIIANMGLRPMKVLFLSLEMSEGELSYFTQKMNFSEEEQEQFDKYLTFYAPGESLYLNQKEGQKIFEELLIEVEPELTIIDTLGSAISGELTSEDVIRPAMDYLDSARHRFHSAFWFNHHQRKATADNKKPTKLSDLYGSMYISARASSVFCLYPTSDDQSQLELITLKNRFAMVNPPVHLTRTNNLDFFHNSEGVTDIANRVRHRDEQSGSGIGKSQTAGSSVGF